MNIENGTSGYIPKEQQIPIKPEAVDKRHPEERTSRSLKRIKQVGPLMAVMLAANLGLVGAARSTDSGETEVQQLTEINNIQNSSFEDAVIPPTQPQHWNPDGTQTPIYNYQNGIAHPGDGLNSVGVQYYGTGGLCSLDSNSWTSDNFAVNPNKTYTESFWSEYIPGTNHPDVTVGPLTRVYWKNSQGDPVGTPDVFQPTYTLGAGNWESFTRVYGPGGVSIPATATQASITVGINGISFEQGCDVYATTNYDKVMLTSQAPQSVGGIAEMPNLPPVATVSHSSRNTRVGFAIASAAALAGTIAVAEAVRRKRNQG